LMGWFRRNDRWSQRGRRWLDAPVSDISLQLLKHGFGRLGRVPLAEVSR
jgi:hypothetical protein